ncbi:MAG TPA: hypothetical protein VEZ47_02290 [Gemmatirosa sp.]|jgi:hypothetical protein|nr:hypothetical protein [Gemmatirosa sp.]
MADAITPALTTAEWQEALAAPGAAAALLQRHVQGAAGASDATEHLRAAVALANHLLPEGSPRKITWPMVDALRAAIGVYYDAVGSTFGELGTQQYPWDAMQTTTSVLASLLPPRPEDGA